MEHTPLLDPGLYLVATPLGNLEDMSPRGRMVLDEADAILAEDTRRTGLLLQKLGLEGRGRLESFHDHNEAARTPQVVERIRSGARMALVSDAGMPVVSDPGFRLVRACREAGVPVSPVPGPSAVLSALAGSGLEPLPFTFLGFAPRKPTERRAVFSAHGGAGATLVFFERKNRLVDTLQAAYESLGPRQFCVARELTKLHEEFIMGCLGEWDEDQHARLDGLLGEITVVIGPPAAAGPTPEEALDAVIREEVQQGGRVKDIARRVRDRVDGWSMKELYDRIGRGSKP